MQLSIQIERHPGSGLASFQHDFTVPIAGVFGPSGSGKTTLLEIISGICRLPLKRGRISFNGETWLDTDQGICLPPEKRRIGYVPQQHLLFPHYTVQANLLAGRRRALSQGGNIEALLDEVVRALQLEPIIGRYPAQLSGGERQRVALGRALCSGARLLLLDEPLSSLDHKLRYSILPFLWQAWERFNVPMLIVSHQPTELQALCEEVVVLEAGSLVAKGSPAELFLRSGFYEQTFQNDGFENVLFAYVTHHTDTLTCLKLSDRDSGSEAVIARTDLQVGQRIQIRVHAHEILVATNPVHHISARNCLPARIIELRPVAGRVIVVCQLPLSREAFLAAELTADAVEGLSLKVGNEVFLIIKSSSLLLCR